MDCWERGATIGKGSFGTVSLAVIPPKPRTHSVAGAAEQDRKEDRRPQLLAVKSANLSHSQSLLHEKHVLTHLAGCPHILRCFGDDITVENNLQLYNLFLEYLPGGTLADVRRRSQSNAMEKPAVRAYTRSVLEGLRHMHRRGYVHCDIKLQNILVGGCDDDIKIADFGSSKRVGEKVEGGGLRGTPVYMAPESVALNEYEPPADIWSLGCAVFEMLTGESPWGRLRDCNPVGMLCRIGFGEELPTVPAELSKDERDFLGRCFARNPIERWTAEMLLDHPFIAGEGAVSGNVGCLREGNLSSVKDNNVSAAYLPQSPTSIFGFPQCVPPPPCNSHAGIIGRLWQITSGEEKPNWEDSSDEGWILVRENRGI